jgi:hypothetical protein
MALTSATPELIASSKPNCRAWPSSTGLGNLKESKILLLLFRAFAVATLESHSAMVITARLGACDNPGFNMAVTTSTRTNIVADAINIPAAIMLCCILPLSCAQGEC